MNLQDLFTYTDEKHALSEAEEVETIRAAQAGDEGAKERLLLAYGRTLRAAVSRFAKGVRDDRDPWAGGNGMGTSDFSEEDAQSAAIVGFLEALQDHDTEKNPRLAGRVRGAVNRALADLFEATMPFHVPERTLSRFYGILQEADGDVDLAVEIAPDFHMKRETFRYVLDAVRNTGSLDERAEGGFEETTSGRTEATYGPGWGESSLWDGGQEALADVEDQILVEAAFEAVDDEEERVCRLSYGFTEYDPQPDGEIGHRMGLTRPTVQRRRASALSKMRKALGVTLPEERPDR